MELRMAEADDNVEETGGKNRCPYCSEGFSDKSTHVDSQRHVLNYRLYEFNTNRKKLVPNRNGVSVNLTSQESFAKTRKKRTYTCNVDASKDTVSVGLQVKNERKDKELMIVEAAQLIEYEPFKLSDEKELSNEVPNSGRAIRLGPMITYNFQVDFENPGVGCYRMPIHFSFLFNGEKEFSIVREIEVRVQGEIKDEKLENEKSPYSGDSWKGIERTVKGYQVNGKPITKIEQYPVPQELKELIRRNFEFSPGMTAEQTQRLGEIKSKYKLPLEKSKKMEPESPTTEFTAVKVDNYQSFFRDLLHIEEHEQKLRMSKYNMTGVTVKMVDTGKELRCLLEVPGLAEKRPSVLKQDVVYLRWQEQPSVQYSALVHEVRSSFIVIGGFNNNFAERLLLAENAGKPYVLDVRFTFSRYPFFVQHRALDLAAIVQKDTLDVTSILFPKPEECGKWPDLVTRNALKEIKFFNPSVDENAEQKQAVYSILQGKSLPAPYILFGPPGTGKTVTLVESILQVKENFPESRILVCAQCNSACDYIAAKLKESKQCGPGDIVRLNSSSRADDVPKEILSISRTCPQNQIPQLRKYQIVVCTLVSAGRFIESSSETLKKGYFRQNQTFTHVFIDEAGQASESESLVAITGLLKKPYPRRAQGLLVLAGDPKQLGPVCNGIKSKTFGLGVSLLERLITNVPIYGRKENGKYDSKFVTQLVRNFRSHEAILEISNELFYKGDLVPQGVNDDLCHLPIIENSKTGFPVVFHGVFGEEKREGKSPSIFNMMEVSVVLYYINKLVRSNNKVLVKPEDIGVIAPYARQVYKLRREFKRRSDLSKIEVGTTETFQGREKRVIIVTTVRSQTNMMDYDKKFRLGFLKEPKRFNVIMTRAQSKLIIVGNPTILGQDPHWRTVIEKAVKQNSYTGCPLKLRDQNWENSLLSKLGSLKTEKQNEKEDIL